jgi:hypothetical protein
MNGGLDLTVEVEDMFHQHCLYAFWMGSHNLFDSLILHYEVNHLLISQ